MPCAWWIALLLFSGRDAPVYTAATLVNAAHPEAGLAPNTFASLYGEGLSWTERALRPEDLASGTLPTTLPGTGVRVMVGEVPASLWYVSPRQVNFLVPSNLRPGVVELRLVVDAQWGPAVRVRLEETAPALFRLDPEYALAVRLDGAVATRAEGLGGGEEILLYATGLGDTVPPTVHGQVPRAAAWIRDRDHFRVLLNGSPADAGSIAYVGAAPGFAGLYQINLRLPAELPPDPEVRIRTAGATSPPGVRLPTRR